MRIAIDVLLADKHPGGLLYSTRALLEGLAHLDGANEYIVLTGHPESYASLIKHPHMHVHAVHLRSWRGSLMQHQILLPGILRRVRPDLLHVPTFAAPIAWHGPTVVTVHDLAFMSVARQPSLYAWLYWQQVLRYSVARARRVIAVSEQTRDELTKFWSVNPGRIHVVHNAIRAELRPDQITDSQITNMRALYGQRYLLHTGRIVPRKNVDTLVRAFELLASQDTTLHLVLSGGLGFGSEPVSQHIATSPFHDRIHLAGWVSDRELGALYAGASVLVFPSLHEGFGLPIVEAMACGTPVVASPQAASADVGADAVIRVQCTDAQVLAGAIAEALSNQTLRQRLVRDGKRHAQTFTIEACAAATLQVYRAALGGRGSTPATADRAPMQLNARQR